MMEKTRRKYSPNKLEKKRSTFLGCSICELVSKFEHVVFV
jgi:hypothetical protein